MTNDHNDIIRAHVAAVSSMLLGSRRLKPSVAILAGSALDLSARIQLGQIAKQTNVDMLHLGFEETGGTVRMTDLSIIVARGNICWSQVDCRLWLPRTGLRAVILPKQHVRGSFRLAPGEIIHADKKPADTDEGIARAETRLRRLVERGVDVTGQVEINDLALAA